MEFNVAVIILKKHQINNLIKEFILKKHQN